MKHVHYTDVPAQDVEKGAKGTQIRWLIAEGDGADRFIMRHFEIARGGYTPLHEHAWEHEVFILNGSGLVVCADGERPIKPGDAIFMPGGERHQFQNTGEQPLEMLCLIPARA